MAQAGASYMRLSAVLSALPPPESRRASFGAGRHRMNGISPRCIQESKMCPFREGQRYRDYWPYRSGAQMLYVLIGLLKPASGP
jgi:hypothetical protein